MRKESIEKLSVLDEEKPKSLPNPLLKIFRTENEVYVYSGHTNVIIKITEAQASILEYFGRHKEEDIYHKLRGKYSVKELKEAYQTLDAYRKEFNYFKPGIFKSRINKWTEEMVRNELSGGIRHITFEVTERCNFRCNYCTHSGGYKYKRKHGIKDMPLATAKKGIDFMHKHYQETPPLCSHKEQTEKEHNIVGIGFYGGEPLLRFDFIRSFIEYFESLNWGDKGIQHNMTTNASLLTDEMIDYLIVHRIMPAISLNGPEEENDRERVFEDGTGTFKTVLANIRRLQDKARKWNKKEPLKPFMFSISCVITPGSDLLAIREFFDSLYDKELNPGLRIGGVSKGYDSYFKRNPIHPNRSIHHRILENEYREKVKTGSYDMTAKNNFFLNQYQGETYLSLYKRNILTTVNDEMNVSGMCIPGKRKPYVTVDGKIHICEKLDPTIPIGDVWNGFDIPRIVDLWNQYAELMNNKNCRSCWAIQECVSCFVQVIEKDRFQIENKIDCDHVRSTLLASLKRFCSVQEENPKAFNYMKQISLS